MQTNWVEIAVGIITAFSTLALAIVAVFQDWIRSRIRRLQPELKLALIKVPERSKTRFDKDEQSVYRDTFYYYGKVYNTNKKIKAATQVQVSLLRLEEQVPSIETEPWVKEVPIIWHLQETKPFQLAIGPDQTFPVCSIVEDTWVRIHPVRKPLAMKRTWRGPFKIIVTFQAKGIEAESNVLALEIEWDGHWSDVREEIMKHLRVRELPTADETPGETEMSDEDNQKLIAAAKVQRWEVLKWVTTVNMGLATASAFISRPDGRALVWEFFIATILMTVFGLSLLFHYNKRMTGVRREAGGYGGFFYDWPELLIFAIVIVLSSIPALLIALR